MPSFWTADSELQAHRNDRREPLTRWPHIDPAVSAWFAAAPRYLSLTHRFPDDLDRWRAEALAFLHEQMPWGLPDAPLDVTTLATHDHGDHVQEEIEFTGAAPMRVPATVLRPKGPGPFPAINVLHDMGGMRIYGRQKTLAHAGEPDYLKKVRQRYYSGNSIMIDLVRQGYLVISIDALGFGQRTVAGATDPAGFLQRRPNLTEAEANEYSLNASMTEEPVMVRNIMASGRTWPWVVLTDDRRTFDYLQSRTDVDGSRLGCVGLSFGAYRSNWLAAVEPRVRCAISVCWTSTMAGVIDYNVSGAVGWFMLAPRFFDRLDIPDLQALAAPRAFMAISGWQDLLMQPFGIAQAHRLLRQVYITRGVPEQLGSLIFNAPHEFNADMQEQAWAFFKKHL